jgi:hypothetical protein
MSCRRSPSGTGRAAAAADEEEAEEEAAGRARTEEGAHSRAPNSATPTRGRRERITGERSKAQVKGASKGSKGGCVCMWDAKRGEAGKAARRGRNHSAGSNKKGYEQMYMYICKHLWFMRCLHFAPCVR